LDYLAEFRAVLTSIARFSTTVITSEEVAPFKDQVNEKTGQAVVVI
jgi:hypothetical protein